MFTLCLLQWERLLNDFDAGSGDDENDLSFDITKESQTQNGIDSSDDYDENVDNIQKDIDGLRQDDIQNDINNDDESVVINDI